MGKKNYYFFCNREYVELRSIKKSNVKRILNEESILTYKGKCLIFQILFAETTDCMEKKYTAYICQDSISDRILY